MVRRRVIVLALVLTACDPVEPSDAGHYQLEVDLERPLGSRTRLALVGSEFDVRVQLRDAAGDPLSTSCIEQTGTGAIVAGESFRFRVDAEGPGAVELAVPEGACPSDPAYAALESDRWSLTGVAASEVSGRWAHGTDAAIFDYELSPGPRGAFPDELGRPIDELLVVADRPFAVWPALVSTAAPLQEVRWADQWRQLSIPAHYEQVRPPSDYSPDGREQHLDGAIGLGESFDASIRILDTEFALPEARAVAVDEITSLQLVPVYWPDDGPQREWGPPAGVLAIAHDSQGRRVLGAPVEFSLVRGSLAINTDRDVLYTDDICRGEPPQPIQRSATVLAQVGELVATTDLDWIAVPGQAGAWFEDERNCVGQTCACSSDAGSSGVGLLALLGLGLGAWLRRRPRQRELGTLACSG